MDDLSTSRDEQREGEFVTTLTAHQSTIHGFLTCLLPGESAIDDILQRTNLVLWTKRGDFQPGTSFKSWAFTVARWETRAWLQEQKRQSWLVFSDQLVESIEELFEDDAPAESSEIDQAVQFCLTKLRENDRLLILSHHQHEKSLRECARIFDRSVDSLKVTLFRLRAALRRCIKSRLALQRSHQ